MSGSNQHTIPQIMLRGFGRKNKAKAIQVVVYRRDKIFATGTRGIGAERFFYSPLTTDSEPTLDDQITNYEQQLDGYIEQLRSCEIGMELDAAKAAEAVVHLTVRTAQLRNSFAHGARRAAVGVAAAFLDPAKRWQLLGYHLPKPTGEVKATIEKAYVSGGFRARGVPRKTFFKFMFEGMKAEFRKQEGMQEIEGALAALVERVPDAAASGHRKALSKTLAPEKRVDALRRFRWQVQESPADLLLPDCVAIEGDGLENCRPLAYAPNTAVRQVFMPVTTRRVLVGSISHISQLPAALSRMFARCSWEYFVALDRRAEFEMLVPEITSATELFMNEKINKGLDAVFAEEAVGSSR